MRQASWGKEEVGDGCDAVQHAHQKGIIHRDLKPSNVMVTQINGKAVVKVIDFGLAKATGGERLTEKSLYTGFMRLMGTPAYMSPEQAGLSGLDVDTRSDIYSLGVLLYELLTGTTPLQESEVDNKDYETVRRLIREVDAPKPSLRFSTLHDAQRSTIADQRGISPSDLRQLLRGDLDRVAMKALHKDRELRYKTAMELSEDVRLYLENRPVNAVSPSPLYLARKYVQRHRLLIGVVFGFAIVLTTATAVSSWLALTANRAKQQAVKARHQAEREGENVRRERNNALAARQRAEASERRMHRIAYATDMNLAEREIGRGNIRRALDLLNRYRPESRVTGQEDAEDLRGWEWRYLWQFCQEDPYDELFKAGTHQVSRISVSNTGRYLAVTAESEEGTRIYVRDLSQDRAVADFPGRYATFSPTEPVLAFWAKDSSSTGPTAGSFRLWNATSRKIAKEHLLTTSGDVGGVAFSGDGSTLVVSATTYFENGILQHEISLVDVRDGTHLKTLEAPNQTIVSGQVYHGDFGHSLALAKDLTLAAHVVGSARDSFVRVVNLNTGDELWRLPSAPIGERVECLALSPDEKLMAVSHGRARSTLQIWDMVKRTKVAELEGHDAYVRHVVFADNHRLVSSGADHTVRIWDLRDLSHIPTPRALKSREAVWPAAVRSDGNILSGCSDGRVLQWDLAAADTRRSPTFRFDVRNLKWRIKPDQTAIVSCIRDTGVVTEWTGDNYGHKRELLKAGELGNGYYRGSLSLDATKLAVGYVNGDVKLLDIERREIIQSLETGDGPMCPDQFYDDDQVVEVMHSGWWGKKFLWDLRRNEKVFTWPHTNNLISMDGTVGVSFNDTDVEMTDLTGNPPTSVFESWKSGFAFESWASAFPYGRIAISPNGRYLAAADGGSKQILIWDLQTREQIGAFGSRFVVGPSSVYFSPDSRRLIASGTSPWSVLVFDIESHEQVLSLESVGDTQVYVRFSPDGNVITVEDDARMAYGWRAPSWEEIAAAEAKSNAVDSE